MVQFVDWDLAAATAGTLSKSGPKATVEEAAAVVSELRKLTDLAEAHVQDFTGLRAKVGHPPVRVVDRPDWSAANVAGLRQVFGPLMESLAAGNEPGPITQAVGSRITGVQAGTILAYLSGKVLGQYEVFSSDPGVLLLVAPNIVEVERKLDADPRDFRLWVCLHEVTHRTQFTAVPWLRTKFFSEVEAFVRATKLDSDQLRDRLRRGMEAISGAVKNPNQSFSVMDLVQTPAQREVLDRLTAMMTLLEGHAEYVMDGVGPDVVRTVDEIRAKFNQRREAGNPLERMIRKLLGIDVKLRQYAEGRKFVHAVVDRVGMEGLNQIWTSPETLPRKAELTDPEAWIARVLDGGAPPRHAAGNPVAEAPPTGQPSDESPTAENPTAENPTAEKPAAKKATKKVAKKAVKKPPAKSAAEDTTPTKRIPPRKSTPRKRPPAEPSEG